MKIYDRYAISRISKLFLFILGLLLLSLWITQSFKIFDLIINNSITIKDFLKLSVFMLPQLTHTIVPLAVLIAVTVEIQRMIKDNEILSLQSSKYNYTQIIKPFLIFSIIITIISYLLSTILIPMGQQKFQKLQNDLLHNYAAFLLKEGSFSSKIKGLTFYLRSINNDGSINGIMTNDSRKKDKDIIITATKGYLFIDNQSINLALENGTNQEYNRKTDKLLLMNFDKYNFCLDFDFLDCNSASPNQKYLGELFSLDFSNPENNQYVVNIVNRITWPMFCIPFGLLSLVFFLNDQHQRYNYNYHILKIIPITVVTISFFTLSENLAIKNLKWSILTIAIPPCFTFIILYSIFLRNMIKKQ